MHRRETNIKHTFSSLSRRLTKSGFPLDFVRSAFLPDWWDADCERDPSLLPDVEVRVARFLGMGVSVVRDPDVALSVPSYPGAKLRRVRDMDRDRLAPAIHVAMQVASAIMRNLKADVPPAHRPPVDGLAWRSQIQHAGPAIRLDDVLGDLWRRGIPVVALDVLPAPRFQGLACVVGDRPIIMVGHKNDEPGRIAWLATHEAGHIAANDCTPGEPVVDEEDDVADDGDIESAAERFAANVLVGGVEIPPVHADNYRTLATAAGELENATGVDAGAIIFAWARQRGDYATATLATKALYRAKGARRLLADHLARHVDVEAAPESDRVLLRCVLGGPQGDAPAC